MGSIFLFWYWWFSIPKTCELYLQCEGPVWLWDHHPLWPHRRVILWTSLPHEWTALRKNFLCLPQALMLRKQRSPWSPFLLPRVLLRKHFSISQTCQIFQYLGECWCLCPFLCLKFPFCLLCPLNSSSHYPNSNIIRYEANSGSVPELQVLTTLTFSGQHETQA